VSERATRSSWRHRLRVRPGLVLLMGIVVAVLGACESPASGPRTPSVTGVIAAFQRFDGTLEVHLRDGSATKIDVKQATELRGGSSLEAGNLWLSGSDSQGAWFVIAMSAGGDFILDTNGYFDDSSAILENGLRLRLAPMFTFPPYHDRSFHAAGGSRFRLDANGDVIAAR
jgi:hypothetical protein